jgi:hypothetical protein
MIQVFLCARMVPYLSGITVIVVEGEEPVTGIQVVACLSLHTWLHNKKQYGQNYHFWKSVLWIRIQHFQ